jgi:hypothetical protein
MSDSITSGLLATGESGSWSVDIEEIAKGDQTLYGIILTHSILTLQFSVKDIVIIDNMVNFLDSKDSSQYQIEGCLGGTLNWIFDEGRLCIRQITKGRLGEPELFEVVLNETEQQDLIGAVKDALDDI